MTTTLNRPTTSAVSQALAEEIRAVAGRKGISGREIARRLDITQPKVSRRIGMAADVELTIADAMEMAEALGVDAEGLIVAALRACRDSNPKPSDREFWAIVAGVNGPLAENRRNGSGWALAS